MQAETDNKLFITQMPTCNNAKKSTRANGENDDDGGMVMAMAIVAAMVMVMTRITKEKQQSLIFLWKSS